MTDSVNSPAISPITATPQGLSRALDFIADEAEAGQSMREMVQDGIEACVRTGLPNRHVVVTYDPDYYECGINKVCVADNGDGMSRKKLPELISTIFNSGNVNEHHNKGIGVRGTTARSNPHGVQWVSKQGSETSICKLIYSEKEGSYGLEMFEDHQTGKAYNVGVTEMVPVHYPKKSRDIPLITEHGTVITLLGRDEEDDTMTRPDGLEGKEYEWIEEYLTKRYFTLPANVQLWAQRNWHYAEVYGCTDKNRLGSNQLREVHGQKHDLDNWCIAKGEMQLADADLYWWVMRPKDQITDKNRVWVGGQTALLFDREIYDRQSSNAGRHEHFGITDAKKQIVIYVRPHFASAQISRNNIVDTRNGRRFNWKNWYTQFRNNMPSEIKQFMREHADRLLAEQTVHTDTLSILDKLKAYKSYFQIDTWRKSRTGRDKVSLDDTLVADGGIPSGGDTHPPIVEPVDGVEPEPEIETEIQVIERPKRKQRLHTRKVLTPDEESTRAQPVNNDANEPPKELEVVWTAESNDEDLVDRMATYDAENHRLTLNEDYRGMTTLIHRLRSEQVASEDPEIMEIVKSCVCSTFELLVREALLSSAHLKNRNRHWTDDHFKNLTSPEALTAVVSERVVLVPYLKREIGNHISDYRRKTAS